MPHQNRMSNRRIWLRSIRSGHHSSTGEGKARVKRKGIASKEEQEWRRNSKRTVAKLNEILSQYRVAALAPNEGTILLPPVQNSSQ